MAQSASLPVGPGDISPTGMTGSSINPKMRKRTKTGCLTCRKRRIKCGEERPTCANCIKSKRQCEGYNQRVVFKPPIGDWPNHPGVVSTMQYHSSMLPGTRNPPFRPPHSNPHSPDCTHTSIQPRPFDFSSVDSNPGVVTTLVGTGHAYSNDANSYQPLQSPLHQQPLQSPHHQPHISPTTSAYFPQPSPVHTSPPAQFSHEQTSGYQGSLAFSQSSVYPSVSVAYDSHVEAKPTVTPTVPQPLRYQQPYQPSMQPEAERGYHSQSVSPRSEQYPQYPESRPVLQRFNSQPHVPVHSLRVSSADLSQGGSYNLPAAVSHADFGHSSYPPVHIPIHDITSDVKYIPQPVLEQPTAISQAQQSQPSLLLSGFEDSESASAAQVLDDAAIENEDDDYWDVQSDEEMIDVEPENEDALLESKDFNNIRQLHLENFNELGIRRYDAFLYNGLLTKYRPEYAASPLRNPKTARVFAHWIHVTGPTLSVFVRNPTNSNLIFDGAIPPAQQGLWTYILPLRALGHQGLLHAMLALASLHIARLQGASITPSYKHYAYSLKRLGRSLGNPKKRHSISTLATSLLLAYYEVWTAEHNKWSTHLVGAAQLLTELDFRSLSLEARNLRAAQMTLEQFFPPEKSESLIDLKYFDQTLEPGSLLPDEAVVSTIFGKQVSYDNHGMVSGEDNVRHEGIPDLHGKLDLRSYETLQDLYWWYARHDMYQSIVSGNRLINAYRKWSDCPPRAPLARSDAPYGSHDHMVLMIGRIADFTVRDRERKLRQVETDGGWRPRPGMPGLGNMGPPPTPSGGQPGQPPTPTTPMGPPQMHNVPPGWQGAPQGPPAGPSTPGLRPQNHPGGPPPSTMPTFFGMAPSRPLAPLTTNYQSPYFDSTPPTPKTPHPKYGDWSAAYEAALAEWDSITAAHTAIAEILASTESFSSLPPDLCPPIPGMEGVDMTPFGPALSHRSYGISVVWMLLYLSKILLLRCHPAMPPATLMAAGICASATKPYVTLIGQIAAGIHIPLGNDLSPSLGAVLMEAAMPLFFAGIQLQDPKQRDWLVERLLITEKRVGFKSAGVIANSCELAWQKAASMGRGPPYRRRQTQVVVVGEDEPLVPRVVNLTSDLGPGDVADIHSTHQGQNLSGGTGQHRASISRQASGHSGSMNPSELPGSQNDASMQNGGDSESMLTTSERFAASLLETEEDLHRGIEKIGL